MGIRESNEFDYSRSRYELSTAAETIAELDEQYANGQIERHAYFEKKRSLVSLYLKQTTNPRRRRRDDYDDDV